MPIHNDNLYGSLPTDSDQQLMSRIASGDVAAFGDLVCRFTPILVREADRILLDAASAEDLAWEVMEWIWANRSHWNPRNVASFMITQTRRRALDRLRAERSRARREAAFASTELWRSPATPWEELLTKALSSDITRAIGRLPRRQQEVFLLRLVEGRPYKDIAAALSISPRTAEHHFEAALAKVRRWLVPEPERQSSRRHSAG